MIEQQQLQPAVMWCGVILALCGMGCNIRVTQNEYVPPPPPEIRVTYPVERTVTLYIEENGETQVVAHADVRTRVRGFLEEITFLPGQEVAEVDVLYLIERDQYEATVNSSKAAVQVARAAVQIALRLVQLRLGAMDVRGSRRHRHKAAAVAKTETLPALITGYVCGWLKSLKYVPVGRLNRFEAQVERSDP